MVKRYNRLLVAIHVIADLGAGAVAFALAYWLRFDSVIARIVPSMSVAMTVTPVTN